MSSEVFEFCTSVHIVEDIINVIFHTILFNRCSGKLRLTDAGKFKTGSIGYQDVSCNKINFSHIRLTSPKFIKYVDDLIRKVLNSIAEKQDSKEMQVNLIFYRKSVESIAFDSEQHDAIWEKWTILFKLVPNMSGSVYLNQAQLDLSNALLRIAQFVGRTECPQSDNPEEWSLLYNSHFDDISPYHFTISCTFDSDSKEAEFAYTKAVKEFLLADRSKQLMSAKFLHGK
ncbi:hypothetical protein GJ496_010985 [Pomphorhynchus laevis]|nr:hypothetical protein GJ496_010985 [Pomphorhynchus laevis]